MAAQPGEEDVALLRELAGIDRFEALARLKGNSHNVQQALNEYFDNIDKGDTNKYLWDESQFNSARDGSYSQDVPSFDIQGPDDPGPYSQSRFDGASSRPPSRTSNNSKSPLNKVIDLTAEHAAAGNQDHDLEMALAASRAEAGLPPQESGVTNANEVHFGPATRSQYEQGQWEMVPLGKSASQEAISDPEPAARKRDHDAPAFLRASADDHRLGALLTIYHEIPLGREIFLDRTDELPNYGHDKEWWCGKAIELPTVHGPDGPVIEREDMKFTRELQRLMAFLDKTDRSYGSVDALVDLSAVKRELRRGQEENMEPVFFALWKNIFSHQASLFRKLFSRGEITAADISDNEKYKDFAILDLTLPGRDAPFYTLYDIADEVLWPRPTLELANSAYLSNMGEIIAFRLDGDDENKGIDVPPVWYPDRYLEFAKQAAVDMRLKKNEIEDRTRDLNEVEHAMTWANLKGKFVKFEDLIKASLCHDMDEIDGEINGDAPSDIDSEIPPRPSAKTDLSAQLQKLMDSIINKLRLLNEEKDRAYDTLKELSKLYTEPSNDPSSPILHKYTLRGVSVTENKTYICRRAEPDLIDMDLDDGPKPHDDQWWNINYGASSANPVSVEKTTEERVLEAAKNESKSIILVYASEKAMGWKTKPLPAGLEAFVQEDNLAFKAEFPASEDSQPQTTSPGKRKYGERSRDSQSPDTVRRYRSGSPGEVEQKVLVTSTELGPQGANGPYRSQADDGQVFVNPEVLEGIEPTSLLDGPINEPAGPEMRERSSMRMLSSPTRGTSQSTSSRGSMDMEMVMEDPDLREESAAVKHVDFAE